MKPKISHIFVFLFLIVRALSEKCYCPNLSDDWNDPLPKIVKVDPQTNQFIDEFGRRRFFHGTNAVTKSFPYHPDIGGPDICDNEKPQESPLCDENMDYLQDLGVNVVRLGVMWAGAEPARNEYNCTYFCVIHETIRKLADRGIYTLADVHQDVLARQMCGEGVPDWFMKKDWLVNEEQRFPVPLQPLPFTTDENGIPDPWSQCWTISSWFMQYFTIASGDAFDKFYTNHDGLLDSFANYWGKIGEELGAYHSVMGYDLLNEPWAGNIYKDPTLLIPTVADKRHLQNVWDQAAFKIRQVDKEKIIFFEGVTWDLVDGHDHVPGGNGSLAAFSWHYYAPPQLGLRATFQFRALDQEKLGTGGMLTEFRMWAAEGEESEERILNEVRDTINAADEFLQSWMGWGFRSVQIRDKGIGKQYARTYAPAIAGEVKSMGFVDETSYFWIKFVAEPSITKETEIKFNRDFYYNGSQIGVRVTPPGIIRWEVVQQTLLLSYTEQAVNGAEVFVEIFKEDLETTPTGQPTDQTTPTGQPTDGTTPTQQTTDETTQPNGQNKLVSLAFLIVISNILPILYG